MLVIRTAQMKALQQAVDRPFLAKLAAFVRQREPTLTARWTDAELLRGLTGALESASDHGTSDFLAVATFFVAIAQHGRDFDKHPVIAAILHDASVGVDYRIHAVFDRAAPEVWAEIDRARDAAAALDCPSVGEMCRVT